MVKKLSKEEKILKKLLPPKKISVKTVLKTGKPTLTIEEKEIQSILGDENRFFKGQFNKEKRGLYFS